MTGPNYSINFNAQLSLLAGSVSAGQALIRTVAGFLPATSANLGSRTSIDGISVVDASPPGAVSIQTDAVLPASVAGLSTGAFAYAILDKATARVSRSFSPLPSDIILGVVSENGDVFLSLGGSSLPSASEGVLDPAAFGAVARDPTKAVQNRAALQAMHDAVGVVGGPLTGGDVRYRDQYYCSGTIYIRRPQYITMRGVQFFGDARIIFPPGCPGFEAQYVLTSADGGEGSYSVLDQCFLEARVLASAVERANATTYAASDVRTVHNESRYFVQCITAGTSAASPPVALISDNASYAPKPMATVTDGSAVWQFVLQDVARIRVWTKSTFYARGDLVRVPYDPKYVFVCTTPGTSDPTAYPQAPNNTFLGPTFRQTGITDGSVVWESTLFPAYLICAPFVNLNGNFALGQFAGYAEHFEGGLTAPIQTNANNCVSENGRCQGTGGGVAIIGSDTNGITVTGFNAQNCGAGQYGCIGIGIEDHSQGGSHIDACYTEGGTGKAFSARANTGGLWTNCISENALPGESIGSATIMGGGVNYGWDIGSGTQLDSPTVGRTRMQARDNQGPLGLKATLDFGDGLRLLGFTNDSMNAKWFTYSVTASGILNFGINSYAANPVATTLTDMRSDDMPGHFGIARGQFVGTGVTRRYWAWDSTILGDVALRRGAVIAGDVFAKANVGSALPDPGRAMFNVALGTGALGVGYGLTDATGWAALPGAVVANAHVPEPVAATVWTTSNGALICTKGAARGGTVPNPATLVALSTYLAKAWTLNTRVNDQDVIRTPTAAGKNCGYELDLAGHYPTWAPNTAYAAHAMVRSAAAPGHFFVNNIQKWTPSNSFKLGDLCTPDVVVTDPAYGMIFQATYQIVGGVVTADRAGYDQGTTSSAGHQPVWNTGLGSTTDDAFGSGSLRWTRVAPVSGTTEPKWGMLTSSERITLYDNDFLSGRLLWEEVTLTTNLSAGAPAFRTDTVAFADNPAAARKGDDGFGVWWVRKGAAGAEPDTSWLIAADGSQWSLWTSTPTFGAFAKLYIPGTLPIATAGAYALSLTQAAYETIEATGAAANITVTTAIDGQTLCVYNNSGGGITVVGFAVANGQLFTGRYVAGGTNAWKKQALF